MEIWYWPSVVSHKTPPSEKDIEDEERKLKTQVDEQIEEELEQVEEKEEGEDEGDKKKKKNENLINEQEDEMRLIDERIVELSEYLRERHLYCTW